MWDVGKVKRGEKTSSGKRQSIFLLSYSARFKPIKQSAGLKLELFLRSNSKPAKLSLQKA